MINHVNTVLVSNNKDLALADETLLNGFTSDAEVKQHRGQYIVFDPDNNTYSISATTRRFKIGMADGTSYVKYDKDGGNTKFIPNIRWSNMIQIDAIQSMNKLNYADNKPEAITIDFTGAHDEFATKKGSVSVTLRIQYKDMPTRYRQWSESYNYLYEGESDADLAKKFAELINKEYKRQRVYASAEANVLTLTGMPYETPKIYDQGYENTVRFNAVMYYQLPQADGITFNNKYEMPVKIKKTEAERYAADSVIVRTREIEAWDYMGVLHHCCWFDPKPSVMTNLENQYDALLIEFENEYHAADDIRRHTKESVELYAIKGNTVLETLKTNINAALADARKKYVIEETLQLPKAATTSTTSETKA